MNKPSTVEKLTKTGIIRTIRIIRLNISFLLAMSMVLASASVIAQSQPIGRLFFTPAERADLDRLRAKYKPGEKVIELTKNEPIEEKEKAEVPVQLTLDGFVKRSSGNDTTWVNQEPRWLSKNSQNIIVQQKIAQAPQVSVALPTGKRLKLKAGQSVDVGTGKVRDVFEEHHNGASTSKNKKPPEIK